ncbi:MAG: hypothetical protein RLN62_03035 [Rickettsiales bacterium]
MSGGERRPERTTEAAHRVTGSITNGVRIYKVCDPKSGITFTFNNITEALDFAERVERGEVVNPDFERVDASSEVKTFHYDGDSDSEVEPIDHRSLRPAGKAAEKDSESEVSEGVGAAGGGGAAAAVTPGKTPLDPASLVRPAGPAVIPTPDSGFPFSEENLIGRLRSEHREKEGAGEGEGWGGDGREELPLPGQSQVGGAYGDGGSLLDDLLDACERGFREAARARRDDDNSSVHSDRSRSPTEVEDEREEESSPLFVVPRYGEQESPVVEAPDGVEEGSSLVVASVITDVGGAAPSSPQLPGAVPDADSGI